MEITWVNHASYILAFDDIRMISDPWISGRVFNASWAHLAESKFTPEDYKDITHIWFSHEHPDHFFPPNLNKIPAEYKKNITVLYQSTMDGKVKKFCEKAGFKKVIELKPWEPYQLTDTVRVVCSKVTNDSDSWLHLKTPEISILNVNDCVFKHDSELKKIEDMMGKLDLLFTQFSYASWVGNSDDPQAKKNAASEKLDEIQKQLDIWQPTYTIPFASYVWFCTKDNFHMNEQANTIDDIYRFLSARETKPVVMYPGDKWQFGTPHSSDEAIRSYLSDAACLKDRELTILETVPMEQLRVKAAKHQEKALSINDKRKLKSYKPFTAYLTDLQQGVSYSYRDGLKEESHITAQNADIAFCSQNLGYCLDFDWGMSTIMVAGTFEKPGGGNFQNFMEYYWIGHLNNIGKRMDGVLIRALNRILGK